MSEKSVETVQMAEKSIETIQNIVNGRSDSPLQLNRAQCKILAQELATLNNYLQGRYDMFKAGEDVRQIVWLHLHSIIIRAEVLVEKCCFKNVASWLPLVEIQEDFAAIIVDLHQWRVAMDVAIAVVRGASCDFKQILLYIMDLEYQEAYERLRSRDHPLQQAALEDRKEIVLKLAEVQESEDSLEYLCALCLQSWLAELDNGTHLTNSNVKQKLITLVTHENGSFLGVGGCGSVHRVNWLGVQCALKKLNVQDEREAAVLKELHHPNIVRLYLYWDDLSELQTPYEADGSYRTETADGTDEHEIQPLIPRSNLLMELMPTDLRVHIKRRMERMASSSREGEYMMPFSLPVAIDIMLQVGQALRYMHDKHLTHKDLKTANILVRRVNKDLTHFYNEGYLEIKLADFGLAKAYENTSTSQCQGRNNGTKRYGAPEVFEKDWSADRNFPPMADVWSFGMTCSEILSGKVPYAEEYVPTLHARIVKGKLRPALPILCPEYLAFIIRGCWELQPERRPNFASICTMLRHAKLLSLGITKLGDSERFLRYTPRRGSEQILQNPRLRVGDGGGQREVWFQVMMAKSQSAQCRLRVATTLLKFVQEDEQNFEMQDEGAFDALVVLMEDENADTRADAVLAVDLLSRILPIQTKKLSFQMLSPFLRPDCKEELKEAAARLFALVFRNARSAKAFMEGPDSLKTVLHLLEQDLTNPSSRECAYGLLKLATEEDDSIRLELPSAGLVKLIKFVKSLEREEDKELLTTVLYLLCKNGNEVDVIKAEGHIILVSSLGDNAKSKEAAVRGLCILLKNPATEDAVLGAGFVGAAMRSINSNFARSEMALALAQTSLSAEALDEMAFALARISSSSEGLNELVGCDSSEGALLSLLERCSSTEGKGAAAAVIAKLYPMLAELEDKSRHEKLSNASSLLFKCLEVTDWSHLKEFLRAVAVVAAGGKGMNSIHQDRGVDDLIRHFESDVSDTEVRRLVLQIFAEMSIVFPETGPSLSRALLKDAFRKNEIVKRLCRLSLMEDNAESTINLLKIIRNYGKAWEGARGDLGADAAVSVLLAVLKRNSNRGNVPEVNELALEALEKFMKYADRRKAFIASPGIKTVADVMILNVREESIMRNCIVILVQVIERSRSKRVPCETIFNCKVLTPLKYAMFHVPSKQVKWQAVVLVHWVVLHGPTSSVCAALHDEGMLDALIELLQNVPDCKEVTTELLNCVRRFDRECRIAIDKELRRLNILL